MSQQVVKGVLKGTFAQAVQTRNVFYWGANCETPTNDTRAQVFARLEDIGTAFASLAFDAFSYYGGECYRLEGTQWIPMGDASFAINGEHDENDLTSYQTAGLILGKTGVLKAIGRKFVPGIAEAVTIVSQFTLAVAQDLAICLVEYMTTFQSQNVTWYPGIPSKNSAFAPFISATFTSLLSTMRRRKPGYGI